MKKIYVYCIFMLFILVSTLFFIEVEGAQQQQGYEEIDICVGVYTDEGGGLYNINWYQHYDDEENSEDYPFPYVWEVGNKKYRINAVELRFEDINKGQNFIPGGISDEFDVIIIDGVAKNTTWVGVPLIGSLPKYGYIIPNLKLFLSAGKGYIGHCGGSCFALDLMRPPRTWTERFCEWTSFLKNSYANEDVNNIKLVDYSGRPIFCEYLWLRKPWQPDNWFQPEINWKRHPEYIGTAAYLKEIFGPHGVPLHFKIEEKNHPIFKGYHDDTFFARWIGGPAFYIPDNFKEQENYKNIKGLADFIPDEDLSYNSDTDINAWGWRPGINLINRLLKLLRSLKPGLSH